MPKIFITGCLHGEWDLLLDTVEEKIKSGEKIELILVTGDCETFRNEEDMESFAAPLKYHILGSFYKIYNGERKVPCPTIIIGGNHEAADLLFQMPFGGYIAPNVYYIGRSAQILVGDIRITGESGVYLASDYFRSVDEKFPLRSVADLHTNYHIRAFTDFQLFGLTSTQIMMTHDWPSTIPLKYSNPFFRRKRSDLVESDRKGVFGLPNGIQLMNALRPHSWFASHHHFTMDSQINEYTHFYALPKPTRYDWYRIAEIEGNVGPIKIAGEWISILKATSDLMEDPDLLKCNWEEEWKKRKPFELHDDVDVEPFNSDPVQTTINFCRKYGIYCPNPEIREKMDSENES